jgi:hypothetical protein
VAHRTQGNSNLYLLIYHKIITKDADEEMHVARYGKIGPRLPFPPWASLSNNLHVFSYLKMSFGGFMEASFHRHD